MNRDLEKNLIACLDSLEQGERVDAILARYPQQAEQLRPYLETAAQLPGLASLPTVAAQRQSQAGFLAEAAALRSPQAPTPIWFTLRRLLMPLASLAVILFLLAFTLFTLSAAALPGDALFPAKLGLEEFRLRRASDPQQSQSLAEQFQQERLREIEALLLAGRSADVLFEGQIEAIGPAEWVVAGLLLQIDPETAIDGTPRIGELARVNGRVENGRLLARQIFLLTSSADPDPAPLPAVRPTIEASPTPRPSATPRFTPQPTPTAEILPSPTPSPGDSPTVQPPATSTAVDEPEPPPPANENEDGSTSGDENDNSGGDDENNNSGGDENDNSGDENDNSGGDENDNSGGDENDNSGGDENDNSGDENDNSGGDDKNSGDDENDNSGDDENDNGGDDENDNGGDENENDSDSDDENDNDGKSGTDRVQ